MVKTSEKVGGVGHPDPDEQRQQDRRRADLDDAEEQDDEGDQAGAGDAGDIEDDAGEERLDQGDADDAARDVADRRAGEVDEVGAAGRDQPAREGARSGRQARPRHEEEARDDDGDDELQHVHADRGHLAEHGASSGQHGRAVAMHRLVEVAGGEGPGLGDLVADDRPSGDLGGRRRDLQRAGLQPGGDPLHRLGEARGQHADRAEHGCERDQRKKRGGEPATTAEVAGEPGVGRIERDGEQHRPDDDGQERADELERPPSEEAEEGEPDDEVGGPGLEPLPARAGMRIRGLTPHGPAAVRPALARPATMQRHERGRDVAALEVGDDVRGHSRDRVPRIAATASAASSSRPSSAAAAATATWP